jgi:hypothetical protein
VHPGQLLPPDELQQVRKGRQVAQQQPVQVAFLLQPAQAGPRDREEAVTPGKAVQAVRFVEVRQQRPPAVRLPAQRLLEQRALRREVPVQPAGAGRQPGRRLDLGDRGGVVALAAEQLERDGDDAVPGAQVSSSS